MGYGGRAIIALALAAALSGCGLGKKSDAVAVRGLARSLGEEQSNVARLSGDAIYAKIEWLYADADPTVYDRSFMKAHFSEEPAAPSSQPLVSKERPTNALAQFGMRAHAAWLCEKHAQSRLFRAGPEILMEGERLPDDPASRLAFAAARNGWMFPHKESDEDVRALADLYRETVATAPGNPYVEHEARKSVCMAVLLAPQFMLGNAKPADSVRRIALELGRRPPTFKEYSDYQAGKLSLPELARRIQQEPGYRAAIHAWHRDWLGLTKTHMGTMDRRPGDEIKASVTAQLLALIFRFYPSRYDQDTLEKNPDLAAAMKRYEARVATRAAAEKAAGMGAYLRLAHGTPVSPMASQICRYDKDQPFDPRTVEIIWEHRNPMLSGLPEAEQWEVVGRWVRKKDGGGAWTNEWEKVPGQVTLSLAGGTRVTKPTSVDDIVSPLPKDQTQSYEPYQYKSGGLVGTPMEVFNQADRRVRRISPSGEQDGTSVVTLPLTGAPVRVCNSHDRFVAACALRPNTRFYDRDMVTEVHSWTAGLNKAAWGYNNAHLPDGYMVPAILDSWKCGIPDPQAMARLGQLEKDAKPYSDPNEHRAWPFGYASISQPVSELAPLLNRVASGVYYMAYDYYHREAWEVADVENPEILAALKYRTDLDEEPYRLIDDVVLGGKDYRLLLTADYTFGTEYFEFLLRTQGHLLPGGNPPGFTPSMNAAAASKVRRIELTRIPPLSLKLFEPVARISAENVPQPLAASYPLGEFRPKAAAGIMTMTSFLSQQAPLYGQSALGMRTLAARVFTRLMCGSPSSVVLSDAEKELHERYIPQISAAAKDHLDRKKGCYSCHVNMDPLASALGSEFQKNVYAPSYGELRILGGAVFYQGAIYGIRGGPPSKGAFLGREVNGVTEVARVLADSPQFNRCAVEKAMTNLLGRAPAFADFVHFDRVVKRFMAHHSYNQMIIDLVSNPALEKGN